ncbi:TRAF family member-associated NF-kappa-B activator isoform X2 [Bufo gargarizans]|uniref:TRAF family member-associated NF-kappa-B activator isoform X2 n=1 Tax=Bufo gargarizans TaxID=30331 RepID=UPI001CF0E9F1|nr:TRAF family member-associated NF-kappa-B activator isoform X2 [Bufo gargarizans]
MDKNTGEQLNRAYEAYRQACMDRDRVKKELQQKTVFYEQQLHDKQKQIEDLKNLNLVLKTRPPSSAGAGGFCVPPPSPKLENSDSWKSETASLESLQEQFKVSLQREKHFKDQLDIEKLHVLKLEGERDKLESVLASRNEEIQYLKKSLKESREIKEKPDQKIILDTEMRNMNIAQDPAAAATAVSENARLGVERIFSDLKEEFSRICKLTREQSSQLNIFLTKKEIASDVLLQFSMPVQCTDEENEEAQILQKPMDKTVRSRFASITPRGLGPDDELSISVESLSNLSVKFPPSHDETDFLESSPGKLPILSPFSEQEPNPNRQLPDITLKNFSTARSSPPYSPRSPRTACHLDKHAEPGTNYRGTTVPTGEDSGLFLAANSPAGDCKNTFHLPDPPELDKSAEITERTVRGPQQPIWKPSSPHDSDPSIPGSEKWDRNTSSVCEFCQAVFPPSSALGGDFLRHLNSHFYGQS